ncbi:hypothetical protein ACIP1G_27155 [Pseudomonas sp. NPDC089392]|uniref:hypothetical protein n=1 Tax=Pseudomonas sp. NPDC089392 TaxID=3364459 RepID=UPI003819CC76
MGAPALIKISSHPRFKKYTLWLMTGDTAPEGGQVSPNRGIYKERSMSKEYASFAKPMVGVAIIDLVMLWYFDWAGWAWVAAAVLAVMVLIGRFKEALEVHRERSGSSPAGAAPAKAADRPPLHHHLLQKSDQVAEFTLIQFRRLLESTSRSIAHDATLEVQGLLLRFDKTTDTGPRPPLGSAVNKPLSIILFRD